MTQFFFHQSGSFSQSLGLGGSLVFFGWTSSCSSSFSKSEVGWHCRAAFLRIVSTKNEIIPITTKNLMTTKRARRFFLFSTVNSLKYCSNTGISLLNSYAGNSQMATTCCLGGILSHSLWSDHPSAKRSIGCWRVGILQTYIEPLNSVVGIIKRERKENCSKFRRFSLVFLQGQLVYKRYL